MPSATYCRSLQGAGVVLGARPLVRSADHQAAYETTISAALACSDWVKTDADTGTCTEPTEFSVGTYDVYWSGGMRYGVSATQVGTTGDIQLDGGSGDAFPATGSDITICEQVQVNTQIDGDNISIIGLELAYDDPESTSVGHVDMQDSGSATIEEIDLDANDPHVVDVTGGDTNVFTGNPITQTYASHNDTSYSVRLKILSLEDSTP